MGGWAIAQSPIMGTTVTKARLESQSYRSFSSCYQQLIHGSWTAVYGIRTYGSSGQSLRFLCHIHWI